jgi:hypothetical protein
VDPRLPGGGGYVVSSLYDVNPAKFGQVNNYIQDSAQHNLGAWKNNFNGVDVTLNVRLRNGWTFQGGTSTGQGSGDNCAVRANLPELSANLIQGLPGINTSAVNTTNPYCNVDYGWLTQLRAISSYVIPKIDVQFIGVFQSKPGALLAANWAVPASVVGAALGRAPAGNVPNVTVNIRQACGDRINQLDSSRKDPEGAVLTSSAPTYNAELERRAHLQQRSERHAAATQTVLTARLIKIAAELTF